MTEKDFQARVLTLARLRGWMAAHFHDSRRIVTRGGRHIAIGDSDAAGFPDLVLAHPRFGVVFAELKSEAGRLSPKQRVWIASLEAAGQDVRVWRPADWPEIERTLKAGAAPVAAGHADARSQRRPAAPQTQTAPEVHA